MEYGEHFLMSLLVVSHHWRITKIMLFGSDTHESENRLFHLASNNDLISRDEISRQDWFIFSSGVFLNTSNCPSLISRFFFEMSHCQYLVSRFFSGTIFSHLIFIFSLTLCLKKSAYLLCSERLLRLQAFVPT